MNGFNLSDIIDANLGGTFLSAIYLGSTKLWPTVIDYSKEYLTIKSLADNNTIRFKKEAEVEPSEAKTIYWSSDKTTWHSVSSDSGTIKTLSNNEKIYIKGNNNYYSSNEWGWNCFKSDYEFNISGNIMSLIYGDNFIGQTTLPSASYIFSYIFIHSKVVDASNLILPATTLTNGCYEGMFDGCTSLTTAPELPATTLADTCYGYMFEGCTSLTTAPELPATTLTNGCYEGMFDGCTSLTTAPELPATTLADYCYESMFMKCTSLSYIKMLATDISATHCLYDWVYNVASTGTFVKEYNLKSIPINSVSGIPVGWTVEELNAPDYSKEYLTFESLADNNRILWKLNGDMAAKTIEWSTDKTNWTSVTATTRTLITTLNTGDKVYIKGSNASYGATWGKYNYFASDGEFNVYGNIMSLIHGDNFIGTENNNLTADCTFYFLFYSSKVVDASNLILPRKTRSNCFAHMFNSCTSLKTVPTELSATSAATRCYEGMFNGCTSLTIAPTICASTYDSYSCVNMFNGCTSLNSVTTYAESLGTWNSAFNNWLLNVAATGTFTKKASMTLFPEGASGIPSGWTVIDV